MKIRIDKSKLHGRGLVALKDIKKGEIVFIIKGEKVNFLINNKEKAEKAGLNWVGIGKNLWINPVGHCVYFNHSCNPNSAIAGKVTVRAVKNIKKGEEITFDYSLNEGDIFWHMKCNCGTSSCRKIIKSIQFLSPNLFQAKKKFIPKYYQGIYKKFNINKFRDYLDLQKNWIDFIKVKHDV